MTGPHPAVARLRLAVRGALEEAVAQGRGVLVACSGGADSTALAAAVAFHAPRRGLRAGLVTVDHGLQAGSDTVARRVATVAAELGFDPVHLVRVRVGAGGGPEDAARRARYAALDGLAKAHDADVLLAHTLDDQAETVLLRLGRGSGPRSLAGMRVRNGRYLRPLLGLRRADTVAACAALGLEVWDDPHNAEAAFRRVRVRTQVLPLLEEVLGGGVAEALARTAGLAQADADALDAWADQALRLALTELPGLRPPNPALDIHVTPLSRCEPDGDHRAGTAARSLQVPVLAPLPPAVRSRVLRAWAGHLGAAPLTAERTAAVDALITGWRGQGPIELAGGVAVRRVHDRLEVVTSAPATVPETVL